MRVHMIIYHLPVEVLQKYHYIPAFSDMFDTHYLALYRLSLFHFDIFIIYVSYG